MGEPAPSSGSLVKGLVGIIIVLGCLVLAGLAIGGYYLFAEPPVIAQTATATPVPVRTIAPTFTPTTSPTPTETPVPTTAVLEAVADAWIIDRPPGATGGRDLVLYVGTNAGVLGRALFRFDLSGIPARGTVLTASFEAYVSDPSSAPPTLDLELWRVDTVWDEMTLTGNSPLNYSDVGAVAPVERRRGYYAWTITSLVQSWVSGMPNYGIMLISVAEGTEGNLGFASRESSNPPRLTIVYLP